MKFSASDYIVVRVGNKNVLGIATGATTMLSMTGVERDDQQTISFSPKHDLMCVLGKDPEPGSSVLGVTVNRYLSTKSYGPAFPEVHMFCSKDLSKETLSALKMLLKLFEKHNVAESCRRMRNLYVMETAATKQESFSSKFAKEEWHDKATIYVRRGMIAEDILEQLLKVFGRAVYTHQLSTSRRTKWVLTYQKIRKLQLLEGADLEGILDAVITEGDLTDAKNLMTEEQLEVCDLVFKTVKSASGLSNSEIALLAENDADALRRIWPTSVQIHRDRPDLPKPSVRNTQSLFAYSFMYQLTKKDAGKTLSKAMKFTLKELL